MRRDRMPSAVSTSPQQLESELKLPRCVGLSRDDAERRRCDAGVGTGELHAVERVERLDPELRRHPLPELEVLEERQIEIADVVRAEDRREDRLVAERERRR